MRTAAERKRAAWVHAYRSEEYVDWIHGLDCQGCGRLPSEAAHTAAGGMGLKGPWQSLIPLCRVCHTKVHAQGWGVIQMTHKTAELLAAATVQRWEREHGEG